MNQLYIAQARELARQMKQARREGMLDTAQKLEQTINILNSYGQRRNSGKTARQTI